MSVTVKLTKGTKEYVPVDLSDRTGVLSDLSTTSPEFDIYDEDDVAKYEDEPGIGEILRIQCLVDTSATHPDGEWAVGKYRLFIQFTNAPEIPRIGPIDLIIYDRN